MERRFTTLGALVVALAAIAAPARAADQLVHGSKLVVSNSITHAKRTVQVWTKDVAGSNVPTIVGDPAANGATLSIAVNGALSGKQTFSLPGNPPGGQPFWSEDAVKGLVKYTDSKGENGPVQRVWVRQSENSSRATFQIKVVVAGSPDAVTLVPPNPGTDGCMKLEVGGGDAYSALFGADGQVTNTGSAQFKVVKPIDEGVCFPQCGNSGPACNGSCPEGTACMSDLTSDEQHGCVCVPTPLCGGMAQCGGNCPANTFCTSDPLPPYPCFCFPNFF
jgi:hypothetical protein